MSHADIELPGDWEDPGTPAPRRRRRRVILIALIVIAALVAVAAVIAGRYLFSLNSAYEKRSVVSISRGESDGERPDDGAGQNFLLLGSDKRSEEEAESSGVTGQRSDVMMLVHVSEDAQSMYVMSFPRDLYVDIPGHGKDRINAALAFGGVPLAVSTVEDYAGVRVDHVALIDFDGIEGLVDALGGVDVEVSSTFTADGKNFTEGVQHMDGATALTFVRERKSFSDGDFQRNRNQQALLKAIAGKLISRDTLSSPSKITETVDSISPFLTTDDGLGATELVSLGLSLREIRTGDMYFLAVPHGDPTTTSGGASVVATDEEAMDVLRTALADDDMAAYYSQYAGAY